MRFLKHRGLCLVRLQRDRRERKGEVKKIRGAGGDGERRASTHIILIFRSSPSVKPNKQAPASSVT